MKRSARSIQMGTKKTKKKSKDQILEAADFQVLIDWLHSKGYTVVGPTERDRVVVCDELTQASDLPIGRRDEQSGGHYRLLDNGDDRMFGFVVGPHGWKRYLYPPRRRLWTAEKGENGSGFSIEQDTEDPGPTAFIGVRACELAAIAVQDRVLMQDDYVDPAYAHRRQNAFLVAVDCAFPASTCFCASMDTGPSVKEGFDLALTELLEPDRHVFVVRAGTDAGREVLKDLPLSARNGRGSRSRRSAAKRRRQSEWERRCSRMDFQKY